jgi:hypothetical protein
VSGVTVPTVVLPVLGPPRASGPDRAVWAWGILSVPPLARERTATTVYGMATIDARGRVADRVVLAALAWNPGTRLQVRDGTG